MMAACLKGVDLEDFTQSAGAGWGVVAGDLAPSTGYVLDVVLRHVPRMHTVAEERTYLLPDAVRFLGRFALLLGYPLQYCPFLIAATKDDRFCSNMTAFHILLYYEEGTTDAALTLMADSMDRIMVGGGRAEAMQEMVKLPDAKVATAMARVYASFETQTVSGQIWDRFRFAAIIVHSYQSTDTLMLPSMVGGWPQVMQFMQLTNEEGHDDPCAVVRTATRAACVRMLAYLIQNNSTVLLGALRAGLFPSLWDIVLNGNNPTNNAGPILQIMRIQSIDVDVIKTFYRSMTDANQADRLMDNVDNLSLFQGDWNATYEIVQGQHGCYKEIYATCRYERVRAKSIMLLRVLMRFVEEGSRFRGEGGSPAMHWLLPCLLLLINVPKRGLAGGSSR